MTLTFRSRTLHIKQPRRHRYKTNTVPYHSLSSCWNMSPFWSITWVTNTPRSAGANAGNKSSRVVTPFALNLCGFILNMNNASRFGRSVMTGGNTWHPFAHKISWQLCAENCIGGTWWIIATQLHNHSRSSHTSTLSPLHNEMGPPLRS